jgi:SAM-dependent methyltransferase
MNYKLIAPDWFKEKIPHFRSHGYQYAGIDSITYLEVGVWEGRSMIWVLTNILTGKNCTAYAIDPWQPYQELNEKELQWHGEAESNFDFNMAQILSEENRDTQVIKMKSSSAEAFRKIESSSVDLLYIDGSHSAPDVLEDLVCAWRVLKPGGHLICDDITYGKFSGSNKDPKLAANAFISCHKDDCIVFANDNVLVARKK